ncbi:MAG TPA: 3-deoxy-7-phosphoheptulonate synthase class II [Allosphingosinicella sp.]|nr:3-deoxy-7-phosphoheptulonate synthase class II [Allosphingosinicella sp.]
MSWTPASWRDHPALQMPAYPDPHAVEMTESCLEASAPLGSVTENRLLTAKLAEVAQGKGFLLQGGDCAETFAEFGADKVRRSFNLLLQMAAMIRAASEGEVVKLARMAGQFAKPRSADLETIGGTTLPSYRGDIVNGPDFDAKSRTPDPLRMLEAHRQSKVTIDLIKAYSAAAYADLSEIHRVARRRLGLAFEHATPQGDVAKPVDMFTSHEALLLNYEQALTRWDELTESWWATSAHMIWIGERTRQLDGAHVEYMSGIANTIGVKCGPTLEADALLRLIEKLDPANRPGRLVLIGRFGAAKVGERLPALMRATHEAGSHALWSIDPMHGNTVTAAGRKTRVLPDILAEVRAFFEIAQAEQVHPGGIHLEMTGEEVTECLGGTKGLREEDLGKRYLTHCDPRLNGHQALDVAAEVTRLIAEGTRAASDAA